MTRNQAINGISILYSCACGVIVLLTASLSLAQDSQQAASARVAREKIAAKETADSSPTPKDSTKNDDSSSAQQAEKLGRRAGEQGGGGARGRSLVLGMNLQEVGNGRVKVVEVGVASPAFDAGVQKGDEIVKFGNFQADSYRKWIDGIRRLTTDASGGSMLPVVLTRDGKQMPIQIRVPESTVNSVQLPVGPPTQNPSQQAQAGPQGPAGPSGPAGVALGGGNGGGNDVLINNGPIGDFFNDEAGPATERAMAQLFRVGGAQAAGGEANSPLPGAGPARNGAAAGNTRGGGAANGGARIGLAGFRNDPNGMLVMIDVGGLQPGNYSVGISDPSVVDGQAAPTGLAPPNGQAPAGGAPLQQPQLPAPINNGSPRQPQSNLPPVQSEIPRTVLAQVNNDGASAGAADATPGSTIPPTGQVRPLTAPPTGEVNHLTAPPTGQVNPTSSTPTGQSTVNNALTNQLNKANAANNVLTPNAIGTLTVDQSGTGRMQHVVEGIQVRNVVGQAIVIYSQAGNAQPTLPPNLDPTADPAGGQPVADTASAAGAQKVQTAARSGAVGSPVAAGIIRLISDRRPPTNNNSDANDAFGPARANDAPAGAQPANNTPPVSPNSNQ